MMPIDEVTEVLLEAGFTKGKDSPFIGLGISFTRRISDAWSLGAHVTTRQDGAFAKCDLSLKTNGHESRSYGTEYRIGSIATLRREVEPTIEQLIALSSKEEDLACPTCKTRMVVVKARNADHVPFLSCEGASMLHGRGRNRVLLCKGVSRRIPARVELP